MSASAAGSKLGERRWYDYCRLWLFVRGWKGWQPPPPTATTTTTTAAQHDGASGGQAANNVRQGCHNNVDAALDFVIDVVDVGAECCESKDASDDDE